MRPPTGDPALERDAQGRRRGSFHGVDRGALTVDRDHSPPRAEQLPRVAAGPAAQVDRKPRPGLRLRGEQLDGPPHRRPGRALGGDLVIARPVVGVAHRASLAGKAPL